jgi:hypothetical protein
MRSRLSLLLALLASPTLLPAQSSANPAASHATAPSGDWQAAIAKRRQQLVDTNGPGTDTALRDRLLKMQSTDQAARGLVAGGAQGSVEERMQQLRETDAQLTSELKQIVATKGWPTISLVGIEASNAAMLILNHTADHGWQQQLLPQLEQLADSGKIDSSGLALVVDRELVAEGKPQRYGSQFKNVNGHLAMYAVEDPGGLDSLRTRAMLPPIEVYKQSLTKMSGLKATNEIVSPKPVIQH